MDNTNIACTRQGKKFNLLLLLIALLFIVVVVPLLRYHQLYSPIIMNLALTSILVLGAIGSFDRRLLFLFGFPTVLIASGFTWTTLFVDNSWLFATNCVLQAICFILLAVFILYRVFTCHQASIESMFGVGCAYLLLGLCWAMLYWALDGIDSESLVFNHHLIRTAEGVEAELTEFSQLVYFSFVTMSTLGYGDITPETPLAQTLTWTQSVVGQFFLAILVARLVSILPTPRVAASSRVPIPERALE